MRWILLILSSALTLSAGTGDAAPPRPPETRTANATNWFAISGMHCDGCAKGLTSELKRAPGVVNASVSFTNKLAMVAYDTNRISLKALQVVVTEAGYEAKPIKPPRPVRR
jgi:copper chaperone CopZ